MKNLFWTVFLTVCVNVGLAQKFTDFSGFHLENGTVAWQNVYEWPNLQADSIKQLIMYAAKADNTFKYVSDGENELIFEIVDKPIEKDGNKFSGRVIIEIKDQKFRTTFTTMTSRAGEKQRANALVWTGSTAFIPERSYFEDWSTDKEKRHFRSGKLDYLTTLSSKFFDFFDFKNHVPANLLSKDW